MADVVKLQQTDQCVNLRKPWREPEWLAMWRATELPPVSRDEIGAALIQVDDMLAPADETAIAVMLLPLGELFGPPRPEAVPRYIETLRDIPEHALSVALSRCMRECKFFPAPVEIRERADEFHRLHAAKARLETALWRIEFEARRRR
jgi:hypothetical protein